MDFHVVRFACDPDQEVQLILLSDAEFDRWVQCEPQQGYKHFERLHSFEVEAVTPEALAALTRLQTGG